MSLLFSIVIPTYNRAPLISPSIESILQQTYPHFEVLVIDDGSTDNTESTVRSFTDPRVHYFKKENGERGAARNYGIAKAKGDYITFLDSDDLFYPQHLQTAVDSLTQFDFPVCYAQAYEIKEHTSGKVIQKGYSTRSKTINQKLLDGNFLSCFGVFLKPEVFHACRFEEERKFAGSEDWLLWLQVAARYPFYFCNKVSGALIEHSDRSVWTINEDSMRFKTEFIMEKLENDHSFIKTYGRGAMRKIYAEMTSYTSLHLAIGRHKSQAFSYFLKSVKSYPASIFERRSLAILKKLIFY